MNARHYTLTLALLSAIYGLEAAPLDGRSPDVLLQAYHWQSADWQAAGQAQPYWWSKLYQQFQQQSLPFSLIWLPPASDSASAQGYQPRQWFNFNSQYGSETELDKLLTLLRSQGKHPVADLVLNHRGTQGGWCQFNNPAWTTSAITMSDEGWDSQNSNCPTTTPRGHADTGVNYAAARDLDHYDLQVQRDTSSWIARFRQKGFDSSRLDMVRGYAGNFAARYTQNGHFCVGEFWDGLDLQDTNGHRNRLSRWIDTTGSQCAAFDFTTKGLLNQALAQGEYQRLKGGDGKPAGLIGLRPKLSVTFVDNHDTGPATQCRNGQNKWPVPCDAAHILPGYAYILSHPGIPSVFWPHYFEPAFNFKTQLDQMLSLRARLGLHSESQVRILRAQDNLYAARIDDKLSVKLGSRDWTPGDGWQVATSGPDYAWWTRKTDARVEFSCAKGETRQGENIYVVGNTPNLGNWDPSRAVKMVPAAYPEWQQQIAGFRANQDVEWKCIKKTGNQVIWQTGANNRFRTNSNGTGQSTASF